jgi:hypothetical protein
VRAFATAKSVAFLCDAVAKAAIGADSAVAANFVAAFAPVVHRRPVRVANVTSLPATTILTPVRDMKHDIALRYSIGGADSAVMEVMPQHYNRALVEIQQQPETYLPGRALAHASGHYLAAVAEEAKVVKEEKMLPAKVAPLPALVVMFLTSWQTLEFINGVALASVITRLYYWPKLLSSSQLALLLKTSDSGVRSRVLSVIITLLRVSLMLELPRKRSLLVLKLEAQV